MKLRIGILGTRGVPNNYGGFEQFAAFLSEGLVQKGHHVSVYNSSKHPYQNKTWNGVNIIHCFDPEYLIGTAGQFVYDLNCIHDARKRKFDILLILGYTSSSIWGRYYPKSSLVFTNMDGLEWKRSKYSRPVQKFLTYAERLASQFSDFHIADSIPIRDYLIEKYGTSPAFISYGAACPVNIDQNILNSYGVQNDDYFLLIARMEPENNIQMILDGLCADEQKRTVLVISGTENKYGKKMIARYAKYPHIQFTGAIYDINILNSLRFFCRLYFHGHSVGGTNPSLLEAMAAGALICSHDNVFNRAVLGEDAFYFNCLEDIQTVCAGIDNPTSHRMKSNNKEKIRDAHSWEKIINQYEYQFIQAFQNAK